MRKCDLNDVDYGYFADDFCFFGGCPEDPIADTIVAAFDVVFSAACEAAITAVGVFTEEACDEAIEKNLGLSC